MIYEYALEPELVASWHKEPTKCSFFIDKFGFGTGRVVSDYPKEWAETVWKFFSESYAKASDLERKRMAKLLGKIARPTVKRPDQYWTPTPTMSWLANAESEHNRKPFHAILARNNPRNNAGVMCESEVWDDPAKGWDAPSGTIVLRTAEEMAKSVAPMLRCATTIRFIDPYFDAHKKKFREPLAAFVKVAGTRGAQNGFERITFELHVSQATYGREHFVSGCESKLPCILPMGVKLTIFRWKDKKGGASVDSNTHPRYILTDVGGVSFEKGLDEEDEHIITDNVDVSLLPPEVYRQRWDDYDEQNGAFNLDEGEEAFEVKGRATG